MQILKSYFGKRLKLARVRAGLKQRHIAEVVGVEPSTVSRWETGDDSPDDDRLGDIARAVGVSVEELVGLSSRAIAKPSAQVLRRLITAEREDVPLAEMIPVLERFLGEGPEVRAHTLAVLYGDAAIADLGV